MFPKVTRFEHNQFLLKLSRFFKLANLYIFVTADWYRAPSREPQMTKNDSDDYIGDPQNDHLGEGISLGD